MNIKIVQINETYLNDYALIPISFAVKSFLDISFQKNGFAGINITEKEVNTPYIKNYDEYENPVDWPQTWNIENWGLFLAKDENFETLAGLAVAYDTEGNQMLEGRNDLTVLWDIRVKPEYRGKGIGALLFQEAVIFSKERNCKMIKIETQNNNVPACKFYSGQGCYLGGIHENVYEEFPSEIQLLWYKKIN
jgi:ribosomal protein S18 acetylase RimI-like enzyme